MLNEDGMKFRWVSRSPGKVRGLKFFALGIICILIAWNVHGLLDTAVPPGILRQDYDAAAAEFRKQYHRDGDRDDILMRLARTSTRKEDFSTALACFEQISSEHLRYGASARYEEAVILAQTDLVRRAEVSFRRFLAFLDQGIRLPERQVTHSRRWLSLILGVQLRHEERRVVLAGLLDDRTADINDLKQFYFEPLLIWQTSFGSKRVRDFLKKDPGNRHLEVAAARYLVGEGRLNDARKELERLRREAPDNLRVLSVQLECLYFMSDWTAIGAEFSKAPEFQNDEPWLLTQFRGEWALHEKDWRNAERYFQYLLDIDPANSVCLMGLARAYGDQGKFQERDAVLQRSRLAAKLRVDLAAVTSDDPRGARLVAESARSLGMKEAADAFGYFAAEMAKRKP